MCGDTRIRKPLYSLLVWVAVSCQITSRSGVDLELRAAPSDYVLVVRDRLDLVTFVLNNRGTRSALVHACAGLPASIMERLDGAVWREWGRYVPTCDGLVTIAPGRSTLLSAPLPQVGSYRLVVDVEVEGEGRRRVSSTSFRVRGP